MSARHRRKLLQTTEEGIQDNDNNTEEESEEEIPKAPKFSISALQFSDSESEENDSTSDVEESQNLPKDALGSSQKKDQPIIGAHEKLSINKHTKQKRNQNKTKSQTHLREAEEENDDDELVLIDEFRIENGINIEDNNNENNPSQYFSFLNLNLSTLNIDTELKRKFGNLESLNKKHHRQRRGGGGRNVKLQKSMFSHPLEEWTRPPSFVAGGIRIKSSQATQLDENEETLTSVRNNDITNQSSNIYYEFEYSKELIEKNNEFEFYQSVGDIENMIIFLSDNPCHPETLLQLALICLKTNHKNKGLDLLKRCLYVYEMTLTVSLKQLLFFKHKLLLNYSIKTNQIFFNCLFHYMKVSQMMGCESTSFEIAKLICSLNPSQDPCSILLHIDYYALFTKNYPFLHHLSCLELPISSHPNHENTGTATSTPTIEPVAIHLGADEVGSSMNDHANFSNLTIKDLPNLQFSNALGHFLYKNENNGIEMTLDNKNKSCSDELLSFCLFHFPCFLRPLLKNMGICSTDKSTLFNWELIFNHELFKENKPVGNAGEGGEGGRRRLLDHLSKIYALRCGLLWKRNDVIKWLYEISIQVIEKYNHEESNRINNDQNLKQNTIKLNELEKKKYLFLSKFDNKFIQIKYLSTPLNEFEDSYEQLPEDLQIFDIEMLSYEKQIELKLVAREQQRGQRRFIRQQQLHQQQLNALHDDDQSMSHFQRNGFTATNVLDPSSPLMQMFWQSILPWNEVNFFPSSSPHDPQPQLRGPWDHRAPHGRGRGNDIDEYIRRREDLQPP